MPHYYFDIKQGASLHLDEPGSEWPDVASARVEAIKILSELASDFTPGMEVSYFAAVSVRNAAQRVVVSVDLKFDTASFS